MNSVFIFSGTTEGREISHFLCENKIKNTVFVATQYGEVVMPKEEYANISTGRLSPEEMEELFKSEQPELIIDATHPYATEVTENIKAAANLAGMGEKYIRVSRNLAADGAYERTVTVSSADEAIECLKKTSGNILLTTGVKELGTFVGEDALRERVYARILPGKESLSKAFELPILPRQIIAMEGPFSVEMNVALIKQFDIKVLVTKNGGAKGGFSEKIEACKICGIDAVVIDLATADEGLSYEDTVEFIKRRFNITVREVSVIGTGMGTSDSITVEAINTINEADVLIGAKRMVEYGRSVNPHADSYVLYKKDEIKDQAEKIWAENPDAKIAVLVSGDTGFFSLAQGITEVFENVRLLPGISSFSYLAAKCAVFYNDAQIISFHGKETSDDELKLVCEKAFCIFSGKEDLSRCIKMNPGYMVYAGYNLGQESEKLMTMDDVAPEDLEEGLYTACFIRKV